MNKINLFDLYATIKLDTKDFERGINEADNKGKGFSNRLKSGLATAAKVGAAGLAAAGTAIAAVTKQAVEAYADYEQLVGGVETLFKDSADTVMDYAANAYKTAGLSANQYMETVTSFSASLMQSLGGDSELAAEYSDRAVRDMADNANKMGTSMDSIMLTYQSLARGNFAMLDNLKLGYGGTKQELERLIADASKMTDVQKELGITVDESSMSFGNIINAISVVQKEIGITGTTALEASETISGSVAAMKSAFTNFLTGLADDNADIEQLTTNLVESVGTVIKNVVPVVATVFRTIANLAFDKVREIGSNIKQAISDKIHEVIDGALQWGRDLIDNFIGGIKDKFRALTSGVKGVAQLIKNLIGFSEPKEGPLSNFHTYAPDMMKLFAQGIKDNEKLVTGQIEKSFDFGNRIYTASDSKKTSASAKTSTDALLEQILVKLSGMGLYIDGQTLVGYVDNELGGRAASSSRLALA